MALAQEILQSLRERMTEVRDRIGELPARLAEALSERRTAGRTDPGAGGADRPGPVPTRWQASQQLVGAAARFDPTGMLGRIAQMMRDIKALVDAIEAFSKAFADKNPDSPYRPSVRLTPPAGLLGRGPRSTAEQTGRAKPQPTRQQPIPSAPIRVHPRPAPWTNDPDEMLPQRRRALPQVIDQEGNPLPAPRRALPELAPPYRPQLPGPTTPLAADGRPPALSGPLPPLLSRPDRAALPGPPQSSLAGSPGALVPSSNTAPPQATDTEKQMLEVLRAIKDRLDVIGQQGTERDTGQLPPIGQGNAAASQAPAALGETSRQVANVSRAAARTGPTGESVDKSIEYARQLGNVLKAAELAEALA